MVDIDDVILEIKQRTADNNHTGALIVISERIRDANFKKRLIAISELQRMDGYLQMPLIQYRREITRKMFNEVEKDYDIATADKLRKAL